MSLEMSRVPMTAPEPQPQSQPKKKRLLVALAGQQNSGKSTLFNVLTGARQHVANYPGVTVDKKYGIYRDEAGAVETVDLPGTYSLTSFSLEERVARDFLIDERPEVVVDVIDASNLRRSLHLTLQLMELGLPPVLALNMMDIAQGRGLQIDVDALGKKLGLPVVATVGRTGSGREPLRRAIRHWANSPERSQWQNPCPVDYGSLSPHIAHISAQLQQTGAAAQAPAPWLALKLLEGDQQAVALIRKHAQQADTQKDTQASTQTSEQAEALLQEVARLRQAFEQEQGLEVGDHVVACRNQRIVALLDDGVLHETASGKRTVTDRIDTVVLNRWAAPLVLLMAVFLIYQVSIVWGYELAAYVWPVLANTRELIAGFLPEAGFLVDPYTRSMGLWLVDSANTLLNYVPIFLILFATIAILEDSGYMARIAFVLDKVLHRFGMHGQSTLPLILGGVFAGGCAVPGLMATKAISDTRARMATIFAVPFMNCMAKIPLYTLLLGAFFPGHKTLMMFYISTMTIVFALLVSKLLTHTVLSGHETSPFVMELPHYHLPTFSGVMRRAFERTWQYVKKVGSIVVAVAVVVFTLLQFPGLSEQQQAEFEQEGQAAVAKFSRALQNNRYQKTFADNPDALLALINYENDYTRARLNAQGEAGAAAAGEKFKARNATFYNFIRPEENDPDAKKINRALRQLVNARKGIRTEMREASIERSFLGSIGRSLEPVTQFAGFDWKINIALLSSFAARESSVATLGVLFQQDDDENVTLESRMESENQSKGGTALLAVSMILFFALYPPCLATTVMVRMQTGSYKWMAFSIIFPTILGLVVSSLVFTIGTALQTRAIVAMSVVYWGALALLLAIGLGEEWWQRRKLRQNATTTANTNAHPNTTGKV
mgnify:FL=1